MTYTDLINRFWRLDAELQFTSAETRMYLQLLDIFNRVGLDHSVTMSNTLAVGLFGISLSAYKRVRQSLIDRGLITMEIQTVKRRRCAVFRLADPLTTVANKPKPAPVTIPEQKPAQVPAPESTSVAKSDDIPNKTEPAVNTAPQPIRHNVPDRQHRHSTASIRIVSGANRKIRLQPKRRR